MHQGCCPVALRKQMYTTVDHFGSAENTFVVLYTWFILAAPKSTATSIFPQTGDKAFLNSSLSYLKLQHVKKKNHTRIKSSQRKNWAPKTVSREIFSMDILNNTHTVTGAVIILSAVVSNSLASVVLLSVWKAVLRHTIRLWCSII